MTSTQIVEHLAQELSTDALHVRNSLEMVDAGLTAPFIGRVRRAETGGLSEGLVRRLVRRRAELEELDRRRGTILRMLGADVPGPAEGEAPVVAAARAPAEVIEQVRVCMDRFELEDLFLPHRRPEPEVQLALDRGLGHLADMLVASLAAERRKRPAVGAKEVAADAEAAEATEAVAEPAQDDGLDGSAAGESPADESPADESPADESPADESPADESPADVAQADVVQADTSDDARGGEPTPEASEAATTEGAPAENATTERATTESATTESATTESATTESAGAESAGAEEGQTPDVPTEEAAARAESPAGETAPAGGSDATAKAAEGRSKPAGPVPVEAAAIRGGDEEALLHGQIELTPALARLCAQFVSPDRGVHTEAEALSGAMRILSDRLGRDTRLRGLLRRMLRKQGVLSIRQVVDESKLGRHRSLLKLRQPLKQVQGHRLLAVRQAQKERVVQAVISLDRSAALPKVRFALGRHTDPEYDGMLDAVALRALEYRLLPLLEADVRLELKERADEEALRFLAQHLRQVLLAPGLGPHPAAGVDVNAKGDWTLARVDEGGALAAEPVRIETAEKDPAALGAELAAALGDGGEGERRVHVRALAVGHGKQARSAVGSLRAALAAAGLDVIVLIVNEAGLSSYASSELARRELADLQVPQRMAVSLARRLQDPLAEIVKIDPRHLGLGAEQGLVSKANLRRALEETVESCVALVGCDVARAPSTLLEHVPGLDRDAARRVVERRLERSFETREDLRAEGLLDEVQWTNAAAFLRLRGPEPLDQTALHPEQYELARRLVEATGGRVEDSLGRPGVTRGLRRVDFGVEDHTWRELMRELAWPGSDPRPQLFPPQLLDPQTDRVTLSRDRVIDGVVSNVTSFGAFVDLGLDQDGMIHVSELSDRYVRDARELVSIGQTVRTRVLDGSAPRVALSLKNVDQRPERSPRPPRGGERERGRGRGRERQPSGPTVPLRAAQSRRDGLVTGRSRDGERGGGRGGPRSGAGRGGGRPGGGRSGPGRGGRRDRGDQDVRPEDLRAVASTKVANNPFAKFFKGGQSDEDDVASAETPPARERRPDVVGEVERAPAPEPKTAKQAPAESEGADAQSAP